MKRTKTFVTVISMQGSKNGKSTLEAIEYESEVNPKLNYEEEIKFPITAAIHGYAKKGDKVKVIAIRNVKDKDLMYNYEHFFLKEMKAIREEKEIAEEDFEIVCVDVDSFVGMENDIVIFEKLVQLVEKREELHICITYGPKPMPILLFSVANYLMKVKEADLVCILYGDVSRQKGQTVGAKIQEMTYLFYRYRMLDKLAELGEEDPIERIKSYGV